MREYHNCGLPLEDTEHVEMRKGYEFCGPECVDEWTDEYYNDDEG